MTCVTFFFPFHSFLPLIINVFPTSCFLSHAFSFPSLHFFTLPFLPSSFFLPFLPSLLLHSLLPPSLTSSSLLPLPQSTYFFHSLLCIPSSVSPHHNIFFSTRTLWSEYFKRIKFASLCWRLTQDITEEKDEKKKKIAAEKSSGGGRSKCKG